MSVFECTYNGCTEGEGGARWKTPAFPTQVAKEYLELHIEDAHGRHVVGARGVAKARLVKGPSNKFQSFDDHSFHVNTDRDIAKQYATLQFEEEEEIVPLLNATTSQAGGDSGDVHVGETSHPVLRGGCSQEEFQSFTQQWYLYAKYNNGMDVGELRQQLLNCADGPLEAAMYNALGSKIDTLS